MSSELLDDEEDTWSLLPEALLQDIFEQLPLKNLGRCSQVCSAWNDAFSTDYPWRRFQFREGIFVRRKFTQHAGWQYAIDHWRLRFLVTRATRLWRSLEIVPVNNLFNLYEFIRVLTNFSEYYEKHADDRPLEGIREFRFEWKLHVRDDESNEEHAPRKVIGTGGEMLNTLTSLLVHLHGLKKLALVNLQLSSWECDHFLDQMLNMFFQQVEWLVILNLSLRPKTLLPIGLFLELRKLEVSPQHLNGAVLQLLASLTHLHTMTITQDENCLDAEAVDGREWRDFRADNQDRTRIILLVKGRHRKKLLLQPFAPVQEIIYADSCCQLSFEEADKIVTYYADTLHTWRQCGVERRHRGRKFDDRIDKALMHLVALCSRLELVAVRERLSRGTALLLAGLLAPKKCTFAMRRNALVKGLNWNAHDVRSLASDVDFEWLQRSAQSFASTEVELSRLFNSNGVLMDDNRYYTSFR